MEIIWPLFAGLGAAFKVVHKIFFEWWLDPWTQRRANRKLWEDVQTDLHFLSAEGHLVKETRVAVLPFDYASVCIAFKNVFVIVSRGRGELNVSFASRQAPGETYRLEVVTAALDPTGDLTTQPSPKTLSELGDLLRPQIDGLNEAFSSRSYPEFRQKLSAEKHTLGVAAKNLEWELNKRLRRPST